MKRKQNIIAFWISFIYIALSSFFLFTLLYHYILSLPNWFFGFLYPGIAMGVFMAFAGAGLAGVIIAQLITFSLAFLIIRILVQLVYALILFTKKN